MSDIEVAGAPATAEAEAGTAGEAPFIIWTFRRTGGTSLRSIFFWLSSFEAWQDEAFNRDRELGRITAAFETTHDRAALDVAIREVVGQRKNLKHCIEVVPHEVTSALLHHATEAGYRHVVLLRLNETDRLLSLALARITKAWGPEEARRAYAEIVSGERVLAPLNLNQIRRDLDRDAAALGRLLRLMLEHRVPHGLVFFEDLYEGPVEGRLREVRRVAELLHLPRARQEADGAFLTALTQRSQGTREIHRFLPNYEEARAMIEGLTY